MEAIRLVLRKTDWVSWIPIVIAVGGFIWGIISTLRTNALAAQKPFLDYQLRLYQEATTTVAILATSVDNDELRHSESRFWRLYWSELALVENGGLRASGGGVEGAMVQFGNLLRKH